MRAKVSSKDCARIRRVIVAFSRVKITSLYRDANSATNVSSDTLRLMGGPVKSLRKVTKDRLPLPIT